MAMFVLKKLLLFYSYIYIYSNSRFWYLYPLKFKFEFCFCRCTEQHRLGTEVIRTSGIIDIKINILESNKDVTYNIKS